MMQASRLWIRAAALTLTIAVVSACAGLGDSSNDTLAPLLTPAPSTTDPSTSSTLTDVTTTSVPETTATIAPSLPSTTTPAVRPFVTGPFPTAVPAGRCTAEAIRADFGTAPQAWLECSGAWAVTRIENCPPETECEGVNVFRWTNDGWVHRGMTYSLCVLMVDETGMPRSINDQILAGNTDCIEPIRYTPESATSNLQVGAKGERTRRLQRRLIEWRLLDDAADGYFGANTRNAIFDFQHLAGLALSGVADERTVRALALPWP